MAPETLLAHFSEQQVAAFFLVLARISPMFLLAPLFSSKMINGRVKGIVAVALTVGIMPVVKHGEIDLDSFAYAGLLLKEIVVAGPWMLDQLINYTEDLYGAIPKLIGT